MVMVFAEYAKNVPFDKKYYNINDLTKEILELYSENNNIKFYPDNNVIDILLDKDSIKRLIINLIKNSLEATEKVTNSEIIVKTKKTESYIIFTIQDNGEGFNEKIKNKIFEPYITTKTKGTGLGMAIVYKIITEHQADINIENVSPKGALVTIYFKLTN